MLIDFKCKKSTVKFKIVRLYTHFIILAEKVINAQIKNRSRIFQQSEHPHKKIYFSWSSLLNSYNASKMLILQFKQKNDNA